MYIMQKSSFFHVLSNFVVIFYLNSLIGSNGGNRCLCKVCADGAQTNNSVGAQRNCVTVVDFHSDVVISDC